MIQLVYESTATRGFEQSDLIEILSKAQTRNPNDGITGLLLYHEGTFLQVLEGDEEDVLRCFERISADPRHEDVWELARVETNERAFNLWSVGMAGIDDMPRCFQKSLRDFKSIKERMEAYQLRCPGRASTYPARIFTSFLKALEKSRPA